MTDAWLRWLVAPAAVEDAVLVRGHGPGAELYATLWLAFVAFGLVGCAMLLVSADVPRAAARWIAAAGTTAVAVQYVMLSGDLLPYPDWFAWYDGLLLVPRVLFGSEAYRDGGTIAGLVVPAAGIAVSTLLVPLAWLRLRARPHVPPTPALTAGATAALADAARTGTSPPAASGASPVAGSDAARGGCGTLPPSSPSAEG